MSNNTIVRIKDLKKYFLTSSKTFFDEATYVKANDGITLDIKKGETLGLVGESGSGKSTLGRALLQLYQQTEGSTYYYGKTLEEVAPNYVFKTIRNLEKDVKALESNRIDRRKLKSQLDNAVDEKNKNKLQSAFVKVDKKIDEFFDTTVKIFGGLVFSQDLSETSKTVEKWYTIRGNIITLSKELSLEELGLDALTERNEQDTKRGNKLKSKIQQLVNELKSKEAELAQVDSKIEQIRLTAMESDKYQRYQDRKDSGIDLTRLTDEEVRPLRTDLQIIFQDPYSSLDPRMTVAQIIGEALVAHGMYKKNTQRLTDYIAKVMEESGLEPHMMHRYPHQFSGGQRQRVGIARALAVNPKFIVADEAVSALDVSIQSQIIDLLKELREERDLTYLFISHDLGVVRYISDRIAVMYGGHLVELAKTADIFKNPQHPYTKALLKAIPRFSDKELEFDNISDVKIDFASFEKNKIMDKDWVEVRPNHFVACRNLEKAVN
ncbi:MAG: ATP-binding cassette domain-containing protein [Erysipelothrix sp.]|nr:ATP-binding cassette domain-containing protein [Erysipelothrix sp.]